MKYLEWNNIISVYFFNAANAGKEIHLYLSKEDVIDLGRSFFNDSSDEDIWQDFISAIKAGLPGSSGNLTAKARNCYDKRTALRIQEVEVKFPPYITYLAFFVLPLIEEVNGDFNSNNYFGRLNTFLSRNGITDEIYTSDFRDNDINALWSELSKWATVTKNSDLGSFTVKPFNNVLWVYAGKLFSQCVFPPKSIRKLPELFLESEMIPDSVYQPAELKRYLVQHGSSILHLPNNVIKIIRDSDTNELGQSIIDITRKEYKKWTGESHTVDETGIAVTKRNDILSRIYLQLQIFSSQGKIEFSFRMKSANDFAEDLNFNGIEVRQERNGFSKTLMLPFKNSFQLKDDFNKWIAKFQEREIRLFISAGSFQFSTDYWLETDVLSKSDRMYLLCKNSAREKILNWGKKQCSKFDDESDLENMPDGYSLFRFLNPREGIEEFPVLTIIKEKSVQLVDALGVDFRTFTSDVLPDVEVLNADGTEKVYLEYKNSDEKVFLNKKTSSNNKWLLPDNISLFSDFNIRADGEIFSGNETTYKIVSTNDSALLIRGDKLPKRDSFGRISDKELATYSIGSNIIGNTNMRRQEPYGHLFTGMSEDLNTGLAPVTYNHTEGNILLSFLSLKKEADVSDFYNSFELLHGKYFGNKAQNENFNYSKIKKASLNFYDYLGYLDYEYETKSVVVNPPQLVLIPASKGRKLLLIGGRDAALVKSIIEIAPKHNLQVEIKKQFTSNEDLLLPDAITIKAFGTSRENFGERNLVAFAKELNIGYTPKDLIQVSLQHFCSDIEEYKRDLMLNNLSALTYEDWARYIFNLESLQLDKSHSENFYKNFTMLEYRLRPWEFHYRIWIDNKCYNVDRNWGKYLVLKYHNKHVILYDRARKKVAVPVELPLPRLLAESIMLLSGIAPDFRFIEGKKYRIYENIEGMFTNNLFNKLGQVPKETNLP